MTAEGYIPCEGSCMVRTLKRWETSLHINIQHQHPSRPALADSWAVLTPTYDVRSAPPLHTHTLFHPTLRTYALQVWREWDR